MYMHLYMARQCDIGGFCACTVCKCAVVAYEAVCETWILLCILWPAETVSLTLATCCPWPPMPAAAPSVCWLCSFCSAHFPPWYLQGMKEVLQWYLLSLNTTRGKKFYFTTKHLHLVKYQKMFCMHVQLYTCMTVEWSLCITVQV